MNPLVRLLASLLMAAALAQAPLVAAAQPASGAQPLKVFRYAFLIAETGFDPAYITDLYSRTVAAAIFEAPLEFEFLARPVRMRPNTAAAMPEVSADFKTFTFRIKPGIYFADDPAFKDVYKRQRVGTCRRRGRPGRPFPAGCARVLRVRRCWRRCRGWPSARPASGRW